ncbi:MAG: 1,4-dihydroxy-2-naphthoate octaprenyltransferase [Magnetococcales bacterium]|nr:1,4-dihydroxy-2-naphthoate octaprenyltransferase [Magnetococcales bacterium]
MNHTENRWLNWWHALRPKTLTLAATPVLVGNSWAFAFQGEVALWPIFLTLMAAMSVQAGTNLYNDAADFERGVDQPGRLGPTRAVASGQISAWRVYLGAHISFTIAWIAGCYLIWMGGWFIFLLATLSTLAGYAYTAGPRPISTTPLGELTVFLFFGVVAVVGSFFLQTGLVNLTAVALGGLVGLPAAAVLMVNNYRDQVSDAKAGRRTLAIVLGVEPSQAVLALLLYSPFPLLLLLPLAIPAILPWLGLPGIALVSAWRLVVAFRKTPISPAFNQILANTARHQAFFGLLLSLALLLSAV